MWHDDSGAIPEVLDPEKSARRRGDRLLVAAVPRRSTLTTARSCSRSAPGSTAASENKEAAWLLVQYLTSKETQAAAAQAGALLTPSRLSVLAGPGDGGEAAGDLP